MARLTRMLAAGVLGLTATAIAPIPADASETGTQALRITRIKCHQQEDFNGADDAYLVVDGTTIWGPVQFVNGDFKDVQDVAVEPGKVLTLMEDDLPDADDNLGALRIDGPRDYDFTSDGAHYTVTISG